MWYALSLFYDSGELGPAYATVAMATAVASVLGGPIAACLLMLNGVAGLRGWQASPWVPLPATPGPCRRFAAFGRTCARRRKHCTALASAQAGGT